MTTRDHSVRHARRHTSVRQSFIALVCVGYLIFACAQTPTPTIETIEFSIVSDPSTAPLLDELAKAYQDERPNVTVNLARAVNSGRALEAMQSGNISLASVSSLLDSTPASQPFWNRTFARDSIVIVTHPANPVGELTLSQLRSIFQGQILSWTDLGGPDVDVVPVSREDGSGTRNGFESLVMGRREVSPTAVVMPSQEAVVEYVSMTPGAIGYVSPAWLRPSVNLVAVEGTTPSPEAIEQGAYVLARPFYLVARVAPSGGLSEFVDWVSEGNGQRIVARDYAPAP
jgi:phosphate transport system substrate-binding protein